MNKNLELALEKATQTHALVLSEGAIQKTARVFTNFFCGKKALVVADRTTFDVAGKDRCACYPRFPRHARRMEIC